MRRQLNEDLKEISKRVKEIRGKIEDKRSKYWVKGEGKGKGEIEGNNNQIGRRG